MQSSDQQRIGERYELRRAIGIGGMARVYLAHDHRLNREVAAKILDPALAADPTFVERFRREAQASAALNHPNIVTIFDTGATEDSYFIAMEYVPGPNLKEVLQARGPLPEADALAIGAQIAAALATAHHHGLIHRDIKPHNVLLAPDHRVKVTDFGIARAAGASSLTATQAVMGSAQYLSPEQALHQPVDGRSDLYSLGIVLYELLTGNPPFAGDSLVAVAMMQVHTQPPSLRALRPDLAPETEAVVMRALEKDPAARFPTADAMRDALDAARQRVLGAREMTAALLLPPQSPVPPVATRHAAFPPRMPTAPPGSARRSRPPLALLVLIPLVLLLGVGGWLLSRRSDATPITTATPPVATRAASSGQPTLLPAPTATPAVTVAPPAALLPTAPPAPTAAATAVPAPTAVPVPTTVPATPTPLPVPTAPPVPTQPPPTATPQPAAPTPTPVPAQPTRPPANVTNASPQQAVQSFYQLVVTRKFDDAAQLWSPRMHAQYNTETAINGRFSDTQALQVNIGAVQVNQGEGRATVNVDITETRGGATQRIVGSWQLIRTPSGWLLDQPNF